MIIAPVLITTLCRYEHFRRCVESLGRNFYAKDTELYIGLDYPLKESHWEGYRKILAYVDQGVDGFKEVHVVKRERNLGSSENYRQMREIIFEKYDRLIFSEDDNEFSPNCLEYMNKALDMFEDNPSVIAVSGYMYPIDCQGMEGNAMLLNTYFSAFGKGVYKRTEELFADKINMDTFTKMYHNISKMRKLRKISVNQYCNFVKAFLEYTPDLVNNGEIRRVDLAYGLYMFFYDYSMVFPKESKVRNWGYDGSGINCDSQIRMNSDMKQGEIYYRNYDYSSQKVDLNSIFGILSIALEDNENILNQKLNHFFKISKKEEIVTVLTYYFSLLIGRERMTNTVKWIKRYMS